MTEQHLIAGDEDLPLVLAHLPSASGVLSILVGALTLCGWMFDVQLLRRPFAPFVAMNPATAASLILAGAALLALREGAPSRNARVVARTLGATVLLIGAAKLLGLALNWHLNVDEILFSSLLSAPGQPPNRMAPNTASDLVILGAGLLGADLLLGGTSLAQMCAVVAAFGAMLPLVGYLYGVRVFQGIASFIPMSPQTAVTLLMLSAGLFFCRSRLPLAQIFATRQSRGVLARRLIPCAVILILALGWLRLEGERRGFYDAAFGTALFAVMLSFLFILLIVWAMATVGRADHDRDSANLALLASKLELDEALRQTKLIIEHANEIILTMDATGNLLTVNSASEAVLGRSPKDLIGTRFCDLHSADERRSVDTALAQAKLGFQTANLAATCIRKDRTLVTVAWSMQFSPHHRRIFCVGRSS